MIPPHSCPVPGMNPGTSTNVSSGMLNASQNLTNRAPLTLASMSSVPASTIGWVPTTPLACPPRAAGRERCARECARVAAPDAPRPLDARVYVQRPREHHRLVPDHPYGVPVEPGEPDNEVPGPTLPPPDDEGVVPGAPHP